MNASSACCALIKRSEGCKLTAYRDPGGVLTVGWGHTGDDVKEGLRITQNWADWLLGQDVKKAELDVGSVLLGLPVTQSQFDALVDFVFNLGRERLATSTLISRLRAGDVAGAGDEFLKWVFMRQGDTEVRSQALLERRQAERRMFLGSLT